MHNTIFLSIKPKYCNILSAGFHIVSGGGTFDWDTGDYEVVSSTETWTPGPTVSAWIPAADLPSPRSHMAGVSIGGQFLVIGEQEQVL